MTVSSLIRGTIVLAAFVAVGWLTGWLVGASNTPVVAALLPLVFGLIGAIGFGYAEAAAQVRSVREMVQAGGDNLLTRVQATLAAPAAERLQLPAFWAVAVILFCMACYSGIAQGITLRIPSYPSLRELLGQEASFSYQEAAELHNFRLTLQRQNIPPSEVKEIFAHVIRPMLADAQYAKGGELAGVRDAALRQLLARVVAGSQTPRAAGRGPASDLAPPDTE